MKNVQKMKPGSERSRQNKFGRLGYQNRLCNGKFWCDFMSGVQAKSHQCTIGQLQAALCWIQAQRRVYHLHRDNSVMSSLPPPHTGTIHCSLALYVTVLIIHVIMIQIIAVIMIFLHLKQNGIVLLVLLSIQSFASACSLLSNWQNQMQFSAPRVWLSITGAMYMFLLIGLIGRVCE